jgi:hypothetical protein
LRRGNRGGRGGRRPRLKPIELVPPAHASAVPPPWLKRWGDKWLPICRRWKCSRCKREWYSFKQPESCGYCARRTELLVEAASARISMAPLIIMPPRSRPRPHVVHVEGDVSLYAVTNVSVLPTVPVYVLFFPLKHLVRK